MRRREFLRAGVAAASAIGATAVIANQKPFVQKPIVRLPVDADLTPSSLRWAEGLAGFVEPPATYRLRVHPQQAPWAERILREEFSAEWRMHLVVDDRLTDVDEWFLEGAHSIVHSAGA